MAVDNFELVPQTYQPVSGSIPVFSKIGWNCIKFMIKELFRPYTAEEKQFKVLIKKWKAEQKAKKYINKPPIY